MERKQLIILLVISFLLCNVMAFLDEGIRTFDYLFQSVDWIVLIVYSALVSVFPILFYLNLKKHKHRFPVSLIGFAPIVFLIIVLI